MKRGEDSAPNPSQYLRNRTVLAGSEPRRPAFFKSARCSLRGCRRLADGRRVAAEWMAGGMWGCRCGHLGCGSPSWRALVRTILPTHFKAKTLYNPSQFFFDLDQPCLRFGAYAHALHGGPRWPSDACCLRGPFRFNAEHSLVPPVQSARFSFPQRGSGGIPPPREPQSCCERGN